MIAAAPEHEFEAEHGLPEALPRDEKILWQSSPQWQTLARSAFHVPKLVIYFAVILVLRAINTLYDGGSAVDALVSALWLLPVAVLALALLASIAWFTAKTAVYTITNKRVVMRVGVVLSVTFNIPFNMIDAANLSVNADGTGDIPLTLLGDDHIAYLHLWPHARPWRITKTEPMLRGIADVAAVGKILSQAIAASATGTTQFSRSVTDNSDAGHNALVTA